MAVTRNIRRSAKRGRKFGYKLTAKRGGLTHRMPAASLRRMMKRTANQVVQRNIETKTSQLTDTDGVELRHNNFHFVTNNLLATQQGVAEPEIGIGDRIGDKITLNGVSLKFMLELNERYSDVTFRIMVIKSVRGDTPTLGTIFNGESGNKMMDTKNTERYTFLMDKFYKLKAPNITTGHTSEQVGNNSGIYQSGVNATNNYLSRATRIIKLWIPGSKFGSKGVITYVNGTQDPKFFNHHVAVFAYSNYSTTDSVVSGGPWNVGRINEFLSKMYYKDA